MSTLQVQSLSKAFDSKSVLHEVEMEVGAGDCTALLGENGAGKSTLLQIVSGTIAPSSGKVLVHGRVLHPVNWQLKRSIGYLPQRLLLPPWATPWELLTYACVVRNIPNGKEVAKKELEMWGGGYFISVPIEHCSHGMKKLVGLALATFFDPEILLLDEPHAGLDVYHIRILEAYFESRKAAGKPTLVSCHHLPVLARFANHCYFLQEGKLVIGAVLKEIASYEARVAALEALVFSS